MSFSQFVNYKKYHLWKELKKDKKLIDIQSFKQLINEIFQEEWIFNDELIQQIFNLIDIDKSGKIEWNEFLRFLNIIENIGSFEIDIDFVQLYFQLLDRDGNGYLDKNEMNNYLDTFGFDDEMKNQFFNELDLDGNGTIDFNEFLFQYRNTE